MRLLFLVLLSTVLAAPLSSAEENASWPQFRGRNARGIAGQGEYPTEFGPETSVMWKTTVNSGVSSPCVLGDRIFLTAHDKERQKLETICLDRGSGSVLWTRDAPAEQIEEVHQVSSPANATPCTDGEQLYVYFASFGLLCYDLEGEEQWRAPLPFAATMFGSGTSPCVADGLVILNRDRMPEFTQNEDGDFVPGESNSKILAFHASDGSEAWQTDRPSSFVHYSTPVLWEAGDQLYVLLMGSSRITAYDLATGAEQWWVGGLPPQVCATPQIHEGHVYVTATGMFGEPEAFLGIPDFDEMVPKYDADGDGKIALTEIPEELTIVDRRASNAAGNSPLSQFSDGMDRDGDEKVDQEEWETFESMFGKFVNEAEPGVYSIRLGGEGDMTERSIRWHASRGVAEVPSLLVTEDRLFLVRNGGIVHCRDLETGEEMYRARLGPPGGYYASPVAGGDKVYFASDKGEVTVVSAKSPQLNVLAINDLEEPVMATPALVDGVIYLRTESKMYAFGD